MPDNIRRSRPEPPGGLPRIVHAPGLAKETLDQLAPLLSESGIDINDIQVDSLDQLQAALNSAVERHNMMLHTPVGPARKDALTMLAAFTQAVDDGDTARAAQILNAVPPEAADGHATVAACIGVALGCVDQWLAEATAGAPSTLRDTVRLPPGHWEGERAARDVLALARKGRAYSSLDRLTIGHGGLHLLYGSALAVAAALRAWAAAAGEPLANVTTTHLA